MTEAAPVTIIETIRLEIPVPPSTNNLYVPRRDGKGRAKTSAYDAWRNEAGKMLLTQARPAAPLKHCGVMIDAPFNYRRDLDNIKPVLDLLKWMGVIDDDRWVEELRVRRVSVGQPMVVSIWPLNPP